MPLLADGDRRAPSQPRRAAWPCCGGGMAGLAAAHELIERGFEVDVYERKALGGKARSIPVAGTGRGRPQAAARRARLPLLPRLLPPRARHDAAHPVRRQRERRVGQPRRRHGDQVAAHRGPRRRHRLRPRARPQRGAHARGHAARPHSTALSGHGVPPHELAYFAERADGLPHQLRRAPLRPVGARRAGGTSSRPRASPRSTRRSLARGLTRAVVAAKERKASTRTIGNMAEAFVYNIAGPRQRRRARPRAQRADQRGLDRPVGDAAAQAAACASTSATTVERLECAAAASIGAASRDRRGRRRTIEADWFVSRDARRARAQAVVASGAARDPSLERHGRALRRLDERHPVLPAQAAPHRPRPHDLHRRAVGADRADPGPVLGRARLRARLRRRHGRRLPLGRHLRLGHARDPLRQARQALHARARSRSEVSSRSRLTSTTTARTSSPTT